MKELICELYVDLFIRRFQIEVQNYEESSILLTPSGERMAAEHTGNTKQKKIALIVGCSQSTLCLELKRNSTAKGNYLWEKAHAKAVERRKRTTYNRKLDNTLIWRIKQLIIDHQRSPEQIRGI